MRSRPGFPMRSGLKGRSGLAMAVLAALALFSAALASPRPPIFGHGPTPDQVRIMRAEAAAKDLRAQVVSLTTRLEKPRPNPGDPAAVARAHDLKDRLDVLTAKVMTGDKGPDEKKRADDLKHQLDALLAKPDKRADDLKTALTAAQTSLAKAYTALGAQRDAAAVRAAQAKSLRAEVAKREKTLRISYAALGKAQDAARVATAAAGALRTEVGAANTRTAAVYATLGKAQGDLQASTAQVAALQAEVARLTDLVTRPRPTVIPPAVATLTKAQIVASRNLFGLYTAQSPFDFGEYAGVEQAVGRDAQIAGYFQSWADDFRADAVEDAWRQGKIPLMTWEAQDQIGSGIVDTTQEKYRLANIIRGDFDTYLHRYAAAIKALGLPLVIRFDHEMNGSWYPWSEIRGWDKGLVNGNHRGEFVPMWRHVHDIFQAEGANDYVIWLWAPNRTNKIPSQPAPVAFYPGDAYVDWIGMSAYYRAGDPDTATFNDTYGQTLPQLRAADDSDPTERKPIVFAETGAGDNTGHKAAWVADLWKRVNDPDNGPQGYDVVGVFWFNLVVSLSTGVTNDWRAASTGPVGRAFGEGINAAGWGLPLGTKTQAPVTAPPGPVETGAGQ